MENIFNSIKFIFLISYDEITLKVDISPTLSSINLKGTFYKYSNILKECITNKSYYFFYLEKMED